MGIADYTYDANKNPTAETTGGVMAGYSFTAGYDNEDRLTSWNRTNGVDSQTWNLSLVGDWNSTTINGALQNRTHNAVHEVTAIGGNALTFDAKGNQLTDDKGRSFTWDVDNKMATANASAAGGSANISMTYDALGRRVSKSDGTTTTVFVCAGQQVITEYTAGAAPASPNQSFVYGTYVDEQLMKVDATNGNLYYHTNRLYCVTALTDSTGAVVERCAYAAYGVTTILDPAATTVRATSSVGNPYMYTGRRLDPEFASNSADAIYYYRARYYDPQQGRFIGRDPMEYVDGMSMYQYARNLPVVHLDSTGLVSDYDEAPFLDPSPPRGVAPSSVGRSIVTITAPDIGAPCTGTVTATVEISSDGNLTTAGMLRNRWPKAFFHHPDPTKLEIKPPLITSPIMDSITYTWEIPLECDSNNQAGIAYVTSPTLASPPTMGFLGGWWGFDVKCDACCVVIDSSVKAVAMAAY